MDNQRPQFDEQAALQALEHLRDQIRSARSRREEKVAEFEAFVRSNRAASQAERLAALTEREGAAHAAQGAARTADRAADPPLPHMLPDARPRPEPRMRTRLEPFQFEPRFPPIAAGQSFWRDRRVQIALGIAALIVLTLMLAPWRDTAPDTQAAAAPGIEAAPSQGAGAAPGTATIPTGSRAATATAAPAAASRPLQVELTTLRPVWMRVVVDGERRVERQVPADQKLTFGADRAIVLRAGDAGSVRVAVDGVDQGVLGRVGQVMNRTFTPRPR